MLDIEVPRLEFSNVLVYYILYRRESRHAKREESMTCRNDKSGVGPRRKHNTELCADAHYYYWGSRASSMCPVRRALTPWATRARLLIATECSAINIFGNCQNSPCLMPVQYKAANFLVLQVWCWWSLWWGPPPAWSATSPRKDDGDPNCGLDTKKATFEEKGLIKKI